uniref:Septin 5 n=1 Tax=Anolis carolinensis TaxID=28377 RepID=H9G445_ANOCA
MVPEEKPGAQEEALKGQDGSRTQSDHEKQYVGFATLPNQVHRKSVKKGFDFTLMVAGESGLGKSTLVNSLFLTDLYKDRKLLNAEERISQTVEIVKHTVDIEEKGVKLKLTIVDTPGFGDAVNNTECWKAITDYIDQQFEQYFRDESGLNRKNIQDNRVHCCLYFISPFGHGLRPVDVEFMKALHEKVNIVPLIAKADCLVPSEIKKLKERIREEIDKFGIKVYQFPECDSDEDEDFKQQDRELKESAPFAVIGSNTVVEAKGQRVRGRLYPWGIVEVENQAHCDFVKLRNMLIRTHMHDLKDVTCDVHYENYRAQCIQQMTSKLTQDNRIESPIPILPLPTPDVETEKLIKMKDEEVSWVKLCDVFSDDACKSQSGGLFQLADRNFVNVYCFQMPAEIFWHSTQCAAHHRDHLHWFLPESLKFNLEVLIAAEFFLLFFVNATVTWDGNINDPNLVLFHNCDVWCVVFQNFVSLDWEDPQYLCVLIFQYFCRFVIPPVLSCWEVVLEA